MANRTSMPWCLQPGTSLPIFWVRLSSRR